MAGSIAATSACSSITSFNEANGCRLQKSQRRNAVFLAYQKPVLPSGGFGMKATSCCAASNPPCLCNAAVLSPGAERIVLEEHFAVLREVGK
jgi:hypothetical protein